VLQNNSREALLVSRRELLLAVGATVASAPLALLAQPIKVWRVAYLGDGSPATRSADTFEQFREGMVALGYVTGRNLVIDVRWTESNPERRIALAQELVNLKPDVIVTHGVVAAKIVKAATVTIPIVIAVAADFLNTGLVASLARPGGNLTGMTDQVAELAAKEVQLLKEALPKMQRLAVISEGANPAAVLAAEDMQGAAKKLGLRFQLHLVSNAEEIEKAFDAAAAQRAEAVIISHTPLTVGLRNRIAEYALKRQLPLMSAPRQFPEAGALMSYGPDLSKYFRRAAYFVDKILKGTNPADIPIEQPTSLDLVVNMKTAKALGVKIPNSILLQATKVIE
jgi:putative ABC transport system substrate-binding protein